MTRRQKRKEKKRNKKERKRERKKDKRMTRQKDNMAKWQKHKKRDKRQRPKSEINIVTSGQFRTLAIFFLALWANTTASMQLTHLTKLHIAPLVAHIEAHVGTSVAQLFAQDGANLCSEKGASFDVIQGILMMFNCHLWFHTGWFFLEKLIWVRYLWRSTST